MKDKGGRLLRNKLLRGAAIGLAVVRRHGRPLGAWRLSNARMEVLGCAGAARRRSLPRRGGHRPSRGRPSQPGRLQQAAGPALALAAADVRGRPRFPEGGRGEGGLLRPHLDRAVGLRGRGRRRVRRRHRPLGKRPPSFFPEQGHPAGRPRRGGRAEAFRPRRKVRPAAGRPALQFGDASGRGSDGERPGHGERPARSRRRFRLSAHSSRIRLQGSDRDGPSSRPGRFGGSADRPRPHPARPVGSDDPPLPRPGRDLQDLFDRRRDQLAGPDRGGDSPADRSAASSPARS